ncbi:MAG: Fungal specific transcription factor [Geoglossum simile]|nr:MAG: Fungal specific transcription factor [Geoglossum simile]
MASPGTAAQGSVEPSNTRTRRDRPCDACRRRKSRCVIHEGAEVCVLCEFHKQECTFVQSPQPRKRRLNSDGREEDASKRRSPDTEHARRAPQSVASVAPNIRTNNPPVDDYANLKGPSLLKKTLGLQNHRHSQHIGSTNEFEPCLINLSPFDRKDEYSLSRGTLRRVSDYDTFLMLPDQSTQGHGDEMADVDAIESVVAPHGQALINLYFRIIHPSFPILHKKVYLEKYSRTHREFSPPLLAAVYILVLNWWSYSSDLASLPKPDVKELERLALKTINDVIHRPKLSTVQAGLLLLQRPEGDSWALTAQLVAIGQELGLHLDCSKWKIPDWERGLRKRLAWALFMQDKWGALTHGRPSHIVRSNWAVRPVVKEDFPENAADEDDEEGSTEVEKGMMLFSQMISLTEILSEVLETFYTIRATQEIENEGKDGTRLILEKAKPVQIKLKEWFARLPGCLRMDSTKIRKLSSTGYLHLAYFATEITLHRRIVRSLNPTTTDPYLLHICRSAAKTRLISAMDFVNRLKPEHLQSFWYFASKVNFALIGTFGSLLWATAPGREEADFYKSRLGEYRWTLRVSSKGAEFMEFAVGMLDASTGLLRGLGDKEPLFPADSGVKKGYANGGPEPEGQARATWEGNYSQSQLSQDQSMPDALQASNASNDPTTTYPRRPSHIDSRIYSTEATEPFSGDNPSNMSGLASPSTSTSSGGSSSGGYEAYMVPSTSGFAVGGGGEDHFNYPGTGAGAVGSGAEERGWMGGERNEALKGRGAV